LKRSLLLGANISALALAACKPEKDQLELVEGGSAYVPESEASPDAPTSPIFTPYRFIVSMHALYQAIINARQVYKHHTHQY